MPDVEIPVLSILTEFPGASPETVEREVSRKIEEAVNPIAGVKHVASISREGLSSVIVEFNLEVKINDVSQEARAKINAIRRELPDGHEGAGHPEARLQRDAGHLAGGPVDDAAAARPDDAGRPEDQAPARERRGRGQGEADRRRRSARSPSTSTRRGWRRSAWASTRSIGGLASENVNTPLGRLTQGVTEMPLRIAGKPKTPAEYADDGHRPPRRPADHARRRGDDRATASRSSGRWRSSTASRPWPSTSPSRPRPTRSPSSTRCATAVDDAAAGDARRAPRSRSSATRPTFIRESVADVQNTLLLGGLLTIVIVFLFLNSWRSTVITGPDAAHLGHLLVHRHVLPRHDAEHADADGAVARHRAADRRCDRRAGEHRAAPRARARTTSTAAREGTSRDRPGRARHLDVDHRGVRAGGVHEGRSSAGSSTSSA